MDNFQKISLKAARVNANLTQAEVANALKVSVSSVVNWESGKTPIKYKDLAALSELYNIPIGQFFFA